MIQPTTKPIVSVVRDHGTGAVRALAVGNGYPAHDHGTSTGEVRSVVELELMLARAPRDVLHVEIRDGEADPGLDRVRFVELARRALGAA